MATKQGTCELLRTCRSSGSFVTAHLVPHSAGLQTYFQQLFHAMNAGHAPGLCMLQGLEGDGQQRMVREREEQIMWQLPIPAGPVTRCCSG